MAVFYGIDSWCIAPVAEIVHTAAKKKAIRYVETGELFGILPTKTRINANEGAREQGIEPGGGTAANLRPCHPEAGLVVQESFEVRSFRNCCG